MSDAPLLTDRFALTTHRARARRIGPALFLHEAASEEVQDRLSMVNKSFTDTAIVTPYPETWTQAFPNARMLEDTETLDLRPNALDLVVHAMCLHWANDPVGQLIQCRRALRPDGLLLAVLPGGHTLNELRAALGEAEIAATGGLSPRVAPMGEIRDLGALLQRAGFALPVADAFTLTALYQTPFHLMRDLRAMGETNALMARLRQPTRRTVLTEAARNYANAYAHPNGQIPATFELVTLTGWAPDASQQQPLRPGSASARLADALGTNETMLKD